MGQVHTSRERADPASPGSSGRPSSLYSTRPAAPAPDSRPLSEIALQSKLTVGPVSDPAELEADRVADRVMRSLRRPRSAAGRAWPEPTVQRIQWASTPTQPTRPVTEARVRRAAAVGEAGGDLDRSAGRAWPEPTVQRIQWASTPTQPTRPVTEARVRRAAAVGEAGGDLDRSAGRAWPEPTVQRIQWASTPTQPTRPVTEARVQRAAAVGEAGGDLDRSSSDAVERARGRGRPMPDRTRSKMESAFGADFSSVRIHEGPAARRLNEQLSAERSLSGAMSSSAAECPPPIRVTAHACSPTS